MNESEINYPKLRSTKRIHAAARSRSSITGYSCSRAVRSIGARQLLLEPKQERGPDFYSGRSEGELVRDGRLTAV